MKRRTDIIALLLLIGLTTSVPAYADNAAPDILGVSVGMKLSNAITLIKPTNPAFTEKMETNPRFGRYQGKEFDFIMTLVDSKRTTWGLKETVSIGIGGVGDDEYVTQIGREVNFSDNDPGRPTVDDTVKALTAKYGSNPTARNNTGGVSGMYSYDLGGKLLSPGTRSSCIPRFSAEFNASSFNGDCGLGVAWFVEPALDNKGLVRQVRVFITNDQMFFKSLNERKAAMAAEQKAQVQNAKGSGVPRF